LQQITAFLLRYGASLLFLVVLGEQLGAPIPAAPVLLAMGALIGSGDYGFASISILAMAAALIADAAWYLIGRYKGQSVLSLLCRISLEPDSCVSNTRDWFHRLGAWALVIAKFVPGLGTVSTPMAGLTRMPWWKFLIADSAGSFLWAGTFLGLGWVFRSQLEELAAELGRFGSWALLAVAIALVLWIGFKYWKRRRFIRSLRIARLSAEVLRERMDEFVILDLRAAGEVAWDGMKLPGAIWMDRRQLAARHNEIPRDRDIVLYCT
jgi:membrane protein DedA with SNARE-associated domain